MTSNDFLLPYSAPTEIATNAVILLHLAGALSGFLFIRKRWHLRALPNPVEVLAEKRQEAEVRSRQKDDERMDELLARISKEGMSSLSKSEKEFLKRMSKRS